MSESWSSKPPVLSCLVYVVLYPFNVGSHAGRLERVFLCQFGAVPFDVRWLAGRLDRIVLYPIVFGSHAKQA